VVHIFAKDEFLTKPPLGQIFKSLDDKSSADMHDRYLLSKLMLLLCARQLAAKLDSESEKGKTSVILNYVNPGWCRTELFRTAQNGWGPKFGLWLIGREAEMGSRTLVHGAVAAGTDTHGKYVSECRVKPEGTWVKSEASPETEKRLWSELVDILESIRPGVTRL